MLLFCITYIELAVSKNITPSRYVFAFLHESTSIVAASLFVPHCPWKVPSKHRRILSCDADGAIMRVVVHAHWAFLVPFVDSIFEFNKFFSKFFVALGYIIENLTPVLIECRTRNGGYTSNKSNRNGRFSSRDQILNFFLLNSEIHESRIILDS